MNVFKGVLFLLVLSIGCTQSVDLRVNGHTSDYLIARIVKSDDLWKVSVDLPVGQWTAVLQNDQNSVRIEMVGSHSVAWWRISSERMHQDRPFVLELRGMEGGNPQLIMELRPRYPGQKFVEGALKVVVQLIRPGVRI